MSGADRTAGPRHRHQRTDAGEAAWVPVEDRTLSAEPVRCAVSVASFSSSLPFARRSDDRPLLGVHHASWLGAPIDAPDPLPTKPDVRVADIIAQYSCASPRLRSHFISCVPTRSAAAFINWRSILNRLSDAAEPRRCFADFDATSRNGAHG